MEGLMRAPLVVAALVVAGRVVAERAGAPSSVSNLISAAALHTLIAPLYFAIRIGGSDVARPYLTFLKTTVVYALLVRLMVVVTYWLAYIFQWPETRFRADQQGVVGPDVTPFEAFVWVPLILTAGWLVGSVMVGGGLGSIVLLVRRLLRRGRR
jgi:hypothetical protein